MAKQWLINEIDEEKRDWISRQLSISPLLATVLLGRGVEEPDQAERFLEPQISHLNDPFLLPDIEPAVGRIWKAITDHEKIVVFGHDNAGWTLDGYVIPRLASGMIFAQEVK